MGVRNAQVGGKGGPVGGGGAWGDVPSQGAPIIRGAEERGVLRITQKKWARNGVKLGAVGGEREKERVKKKKKSL